LPAGAEVRRASGRPESRPPPRRSARWVHRASGIRCGPEPVPPANWWKLRVPLARHATFARSPRRLGDEDPADPTGAAPRRGAEPEGSAETPHPVACPKVWSHGDFRPVRLPAGRSAWPRRAGGHLAGARLAAVAVSVTGVTVLACGHRYQASLPKQGAPCAGWRSLHSPGASRRSGPRGAAGNLAAGATQFPSSPLASGNPLAWAGSSGLGGVLLLAGSGISPLPQGQGTGRSPGHRGVESGPSSASTTVRPEPRVVSLDAACAAPSAFRAAAEAAVRGTSVRACQHRLGRSRGV